jgi:hypothetical protein
MVPVVECPDRHFTPHRRINAYPPRLPPAAAILIWTSKWSIVAALTPSTSSRSAWYIPSPEKHGRLKATWGP